MVFTDIINRGGGDRVLELFASDKQSGIDRSAGVTVRTDGYLRLIPAGDKLVLKPAESVTLTPDVLHVFWTQGSDCLIGEAMFEFSPISADHA